MQAICCTCATLRAACSCVGSNGMQVALTGFGCCNRVGVSSSDKGVLCQEADTADGTTEKPSSDAWVGPGMVVSKELKEDIDLGAADKHGMHAAKL